MRVILCLVIVLVASSAGFAQGKSAAEQDSSSLKQRYLTLKAKTETFNEYKVIREIQLDAFWKMTMDSLGIVQGRLKDARSDIKKLKAEIASLTALIEQKDAAAASVLHDSTHIRFVGIDFNKAFFITLFLAIVLSLLALSGLLFWRFKAVFSSSRESRQLFDQLHAEFEGYKHKALEKQMRLSRELQTERNRMQDKLSAR